MNKRQKEVIQSQLNSEQKTLDELKEVYEQALRDCEKKIQELSERTDMENIQSIVYQKRYQEAIKAQLEGILSNLQSNSYATISDYLTRCYRDGYTGVMYDLMGQGIPFIIPIAQEAVTRAIQLDSKLSKSLYDRLGEDVNALKKAVRAEVSRGIANGSTWNQVAGQLARNMKNTPFQRAYNNSIRIARTEGHRIQIQSALDAMYVAKSNGADVVKQWDSTLDGKTRPTHRELDGKLAEVEEKFKYSGGEVLAPMMFGNPAEDCNCRCALLQRARWELDEDELQTLKERAEYFGLDKTTDFEEYQRKYLGISDNKLKKNGKTSVENVTDNGIITLVDINKMITPYERMVLDKVPAKEGYFDFAAHGTPDYINYGERGKSMSAREVAKIISHNEKYNGQKVRMLSCMTGSSDSGFAQQLANALGVEVEAPTDILFVYPDGSFKIGYTGTGQMKTFKPRGKG